MHTDTDRNGVLLAQEIDRLTGQTLAERRADLDRRIDARVLQLGREAFKPASNTDSLPVCQSAPATTEKRTPSKPPAAVSRPRSSRKSSTRKGRQKAS